MSYLPDNISIEYGPDRPLTRAERAMDDPIAAEGIVRDAASRLAAAYQKLDEAQFIATESGDLIQAASIAAVMRQAASLMEGVAS